nr:cholinesterase-like [Nomia melanderi]
MCPDKITMERAFWIAFVVLSSLSQCLCDDVLRTNVVDTKSGRVRGIMKRTVWNSVEYQAYLGIPYALPPVKHLRFELPVPVRPWGYIFEAVKESSSCIQMDLFTDEFIGSEDCLYLNVYVTGNNNATEGKPKLKPVMIWIYGGAYVSGYSDSALYGPDLFLEQDVVFVSFNYRVGSLGFLKTDARNASCNVGLWDQNLVLRWVNENIAAFGGDPNWVTLYGESAGAASVGFHTMSQKSRGLFHKAIYQSGTPLCQWAYLMPLVAEKHARTLGELLGYKSLDKEGLLNFLRTVPADELIHKQQQVGLDILAFAPTTENPDLISDDRAFLTDCPLTRYRDGDFSKMPTMMGMNGEEALFFVNYYIKTGQHDQYLWQWFLQLFAITHFPVGYLGSVTNVVLRQLPKSVIRLITNFATEAAFTAPIDLTRKLIIKQNGDNPFYYYLLKYRSMYNLHSTMGETINGTSHVDDIAYLFNVKNLSAPTDPNDPFNVFRRKMVSLWTNFAKYGDPTPPDLRGVNTFDNVWPDATKTGKILEINETTKVREGMPGSFAPIYQPILESILPLETGCVNSLLHSLTSTPL